MSNIEWKKGYEEGFAAGWKAAKDKQMNYTNYPPVYYNPDIPTATMADNFAMNGLNTHTVTLTENNKTIHNLTDHTRIV